MPCTKCEEGKYKWGETGKCEYATKEDCESANHKYSKMKPTPLGKKTYEEYAKELKEYNLSSVHRVELGLADDVEKLTQQAKEQITEIARDNGFIKETEKSELKDMRLVDKTKGKATKVRTNLEKKLDKLEKAAKDLGIKIPTGEASKVLSKLISLL
jgi:hypothetical protein